MSRRKRATDKHFRKIVAQEFGVELNTKDLGLPEKTAPSPNQNDRFGDAEHQEPFNFAAAMEAADPYPDDYRYQPSPLPPPRPTRPRQWGWSLLLAGLGLGLAGLFGVPIPRPLGIVGGVVAVVGLTILLLQLRHRRPDEPDDDGAHL